MVPASVRTVMWGRYSRPGLSMPLSTRNRSLAAAEPKTLGYNVRISWTHPS
jgi:hypothetical protein